MPPVDNELVPARPAVEVMPTPAALLPATSDIAVDPAAAVDPAVIELPAVGAVAAAA
jgi:hypothetical protein